MTILTLDQLFKITPHGRKKVLEIYYPHLCKAMEEFHINTKARVACFLAQLIHESGSFVYMEEIASGAAYDMRASLGNQEPEAIAVAMANYTTTGRWFKGHGPIQITGYYNHLKCGKALGLDLVRHPKLICEPENAFRSSGWFFESHGCLPYADKLDFEAISKIINLGNAKTSRVPNGKADRDKNFALAREVLHV
jgi:putative chitinase